MHLKIKNLQAYLRSVEISTSQCKEKRDLVDLIIKYAKSRRSAFSNSSSQNTSNQTFHSPGGNQSQSATRVQGDIEIPPGPFGVPHQVSHGFRQGPLPFRPVQQQNNNGERWGETLPGMPQYSSSSSSNDDNANHHTATGLQQDKSSKQVNNPHAFQTILKFYMLLAFKNIYTRLKNFIYVLLKLQTHLSDV